MVHVSIEYKSLGAWQVADGQLTARVDANTNAFTILKKILSSSEFLGASSKGGELSSGHLPQTQVNTSNFKEVKLTTLLNTFYSWTP